MKWVLLLGLMVSLAYGRTIFDYERDGLENKQEGSPGKSVSGQYEWRAPDGKVTEISYVADHLGFRLVNDPEIKEPSEPPSPSESTAQSKAVVVGGSGGEEEAEEDEGEEYEAEEGEEEEQKEGEEEEEASHGEVIDQEKKEADGEENLKEAETTNTAAAKAENTEETEAKTKPKEETSDDENKGKSFSQNSEQEQETADKEEASKTEESRTGSADATEEEPDEKPTRVVQPPALVPIKVDATFADTPVAEELIIEEAPIIAAAEVTHASEPMVAPIAEVFMDPQDDIIVVGMAKSFDGNDDREARMPIAVAVEARELNVDPETIPAVEIEPNQMPIVSYPQAEPLQQPIVEVSPINVDRDIEEAESRMIALEPETQNSQTSVLVREAPQAAPLVEFQEIPIESRSEPVNLISQQIQMPVFEIPQQMQVPVYEIPQRMQVPVYEIPQQMQVPVYEIPRQVIQVPADLALPSALPQIQFFELETFPAVIDRTLETEPSVEQTPSAVFVRKIADPDKHESQKASNQDLELAIPQHRFQVVKSGRSMDSAPVQITKEHDPFMDLYFIPESFQLSEPKPSQSAVHIVEVEAPIAKKEMIIKAKSFPKVSESENKLDKTIFDGSFVDTINFVPVDLSLPVEIQTPMIKEEDFVQEPESISAPVQFIQIPVAFFDAPETVSSPRMVEVDIDAAPVATASGLSVPQAVAAPPILDREIRLSPIEEVPMKISKEQPKEVLLEVSSSSSSAEDIQGPLLPPLLKISRTMTAAT